LSLRTVFILFLEVNRTRSFLEANGIHVETSLAAFAKIPLHSILVGSVRACIVKPKRLLPTVDVSEIESELEARPGVVLVEHRHLVVNLLRAEGASQLKEKPQINHERSLDVPLR
jgi:hypothetical protein